MLGATSDPLGREGDGDAGRSESSSDGATNLPWRDRWRPPRRAPRCRDAAVEAARIEWAFLTLSADSSQPHSTVFQVLISATEIQPLRLLPLFLIAGILLYFNVLSSYFLSDDFYLISHVAHHGIANPWSQFFRPVVVLSYLVEFKVWNLHPVGYHFTNVLLHGTNAFLVSRLSLILLEPIKLPNSTSRLLSLLSGAVFLALPCHSEAVSWISGRTDVIAASLMLVSLIAFCQYVLGRKSSSSLALSVVSFLGALLAKESAIPFPLVAVMMGLTLAVAGATVSYLSRVVKGFVLLLAILMMYLLVRFLSINAVVGGYGMRAHVYLDPNTVDRLGHFALRAFLPPLPNGPYIYFSNARALMFGAVLVILLSFGLRFLWGTRRRILLLVLTLMVCFLVTVPVLGSMSVSTVDTQGERFLYFPSVFASIGAVYVLAGLIGWRVATIPLLIIFIAFSTVRLYQLNKNWVVAGDLARVIASEIASSAVRPAVVLVNAPDNLRGAYVFRNGLAQAVTEFIHSQAVREVTVVAMHTLGSVQDEIAIEQAGSVPGRCSVRLLNDKTRFVVVRSGTGRDRGGTGSSFEFELKELPQNTDVMYYSAGRVRRLPRGCVRE
jgi:protein O-mannosyl-transferase